MTRPAASVLLLLAVACAAARAAAGAPPARIAIDEVRTTARGVTVTWHAAESGRFVVWIGGSYCGNGLKGPDGPYRAPRTRTVVMPTRRALRADSAIRVCLRTGVGTLSEATKVPARATPARISIDDVTATARGVAVNWHATESGRFVVWIDGAYCGNGNKGPDGRYRAGRTRTVVIPSRRALRAGSAIRVCLRTGAGTLSDAMKLPARATPARISIDQLDQQAGAWTMSWHAALSGRFTVWVRGAYCGAGAKVASGRYYEWSGAASVKLGSGVVRPGVAVRVCLQTPAGTLSDAAQAVETLEPPAESHWALYSMLVVVAVLFTLGWIVPFVLKRRRAASKTTRKAEGL